MIKKIRQQYDIELNVDDLYALARACSVVEAITSSAIDGVAGFKIAGVPSANSRAILIKIPNNGCAARAPICRILPEGSAKIFS